MPDNRKLDLSGGFDNISNDLLKDLKAATEEVKQRNEARAKSTAKDAERAQSRKMITLISVISAAVILLLSYWMVFARQSEPQISASSSQATKVQTTTKIADPTANVKTPSKSNSQPVAAGAPVGRDSQIVEHPSDEYEQPSSDAGM